MIEAFFISILDQTSKKFDLFLPSDSRLQILQLTANQRLDNLGEDHPLAVEYKRLSNHSK